MYVVWGVSLFGLVNWGCVCVCVQCVGAGTFHSTQTEVKARQRSKDNLQELVLSFHHEFQRLNPGKFPYSVRHLTDPHLFFSDLYGIKLGFVENWYLRYCFLIHKMVSFH